ncbi:YbaY family lipoprotein [Streptomyces sp. ID05-26A]|nr:YbaY family lipoprotein [Streptomyces sp. ID05-26A]
MRGVVVIPAGTPAFGRAVLRVRLLDVTLADAPAVTLAEHVGEFSRDYTAEQRVPFDFGLADGSMLSVAAHVDVSGDGQVRHGDLVTTSAVEPSDGVVVRVEPV